MSDASAQQFINTPPSTPTVTATPTIGSVSGQSQIQPSSELITPTDPGLMMPKRGKRKVLMLGGGVALVLLLTSGFVFGYYLPNTPTNVYSTGLNRSGKALNSLVESATTEKQLEAYNTSTIKGSVIANMDGSTYSGDFSTTFDKTTMDGGLNIKLAAKGESAKTLNIKAVSQIPTGSVYPDVYFQLTGIKSLGLDDFVPGISDYDGKWISVSSDYLKSLGSSYGGLTGDNTKDQITATDIAELAQAATNVTQQYLFTTATDKAVFVKQSFVGKEKMDGLNTYHYKVGVNIDHATKFCEAFDNALYSTQAYKKLSGETAKQISDDKQTATKDCSNNVKDEIKSTDTFDLWVDGKYKLIHKFRIYDREDKKSYTDIGQTYLGGNKLSLFTNFHDEKGKTDGSFTLNTDVKAAKTSGQLSMKSTDKTYPYEVLVKMSAEASTQKVAFNKPASSTPIQDILKKFGIDPAAGASALGGSEDQQNAADTKVTSDFLSIDSHIEAYYAENGFYPTLAQLNDSKWRAANMKGLDSDSLQPPNSSKTTLGSTPSKDQYSYVPATCTNGSDCQDFTLSAILSTGETYTRQSTGFDNATSST